MWLPLFLLLAGFSDASQSAGRITLPAGVVGVSFGTAQRYKDAAGKEMCAIAQPLPDPPAFERGVTEMSYGIGLQPLMVKSASTQVIAPGEQGYLQRTPCNAFAPVKGGFSQTLLGSTITRLDKKPLQSGSYILRITVDAQTADIPFTIK
jgi:hypothetical protein